MGEDMGLDKRLIRPSPPLLRGRFVRWCIYLNRLYLCMYVLYDVLYSMHVPMPFAYPSALEETSSAHSISPKTCVCMASASQGVRRRGQALLLL